MKTLAVIYALPDKYAMSLQVKGITSKFRSMKVKEIKQRFWPGIGIIKILLVAKNVLKSLALTGKSDTIFASAGLVASSIPALACKKLKGNELIVQWDDSFEDLSEKKPKPWNLNYWEYESVKNADKIFAVSKKLAEIACKIRGTNANIFYIPDGVDTEVFNPAKYSKNRIRAKLDIGTEEPVFCFVSYINRKGNWFAGKRHADIFLKLKNEGMKFRVLVIGFGPGLGLFKKYVEENGMKDYFIFTGYVNHSEVPEYMSAANFAILISSGTFTALVRSSCKLKEYISIGLVVFADRVGENITDLGSGKAGVLFETEGELIAKIKKMVRNKKSAVSLSKAARSQSKKFDFAELAKKWEKAINSA